MNRRNFLRAGGTLGLLGGVSGITLGAPTARLAQLLSNVDNDRVLLLIQLQGGNDGLNTLVPLDQLPVLNGVRPQVALPESTLLPLGPGASRAFHPGMVGINNLWKEGKLGIVQSVGYANQNRSHFRSTDIWSTASPANVEYKTGWMGRVIERDHPGYPQDYPNADSLDPLAITIGNSASETCQGRVTNVSQTINDPFNVTTLAPGGDTSLADNRFGEQVAFLRTAISQTNAYGTIIKAAAESGNSVVDYPDLPFANKLKNVARMIHGGLRTRVYVVSLGGFDTHAQQVTGGDTTTGKHAELLQELSLGIEAFQRDLEGLGIADRVLGMTYSEFGRRIRSNAGNGTDHGDAAPLFVFGGCAGGAVMGENPQIDPDVEQRTGVPMQFDFRDVYGSVLTDWFGLPQGEVRDLLYPDFQYLSIVSNCAAGTSLPVDYLGISCTGREQIIMLDWQTADEIDNQGFEVERSADGIGFERISWVRGKGPNSAYAFEDREVSEGRLYYYRLRQLDFDGEASLSRVVSGRLSGSIIADWAVGLPFPNPAAEHAQIKVYAPTDALVRYRITDAAGRQLRSESRALSGRRDHLLELPTGRLPVGAYTVELIGGEQRFTRRLMVAR